MSTENRRAAMLEVPDEKARSGDQVRYRITNTGSIELICGVGYVLERKTSDGWVLMNAGMAFAAVGIRVAAGDSLELEANIPVDALAGAYRIRTSVAGIPADRNADLTASFDVDCREQSPEDDPR